MGSVTAEENEKLIEKIRRFIPLCGGGGYWIMEEKQNKEKNDKLYS